MHRSKPNRQGATGGDSSVVIRNAFQQIAQGLTRLEEGLQLQGQEADRRLQEAMRQQEQNAERRLQEATRQQIQEAKDSFQQSLRLQEKRCATALREAVGQMEIKLQEKNDAIHALEQQLGKAKGRQSAAEEKAKGGSTQQEADGWEEFQRLRVQHRIQEAKDKMTTARTTPSALGEDLLKAITNESLTDVRRLLDAGADVNYLNSEGRTPLLRALGIARREDMVTLLLERGADVNAVNDNGNSAMHLAVWYDYSGRCLHRLVAAGGDVNARCGRGVTPLHWAVEKSNKAAVQALLSAGARRDLKPWQGFFKDTTPYEVAMSPDIRDLLRST